MDKSVTIVICSHNKNNLLLNTIRECQRFRQANSFLFVIHSGDQGAISDTDTVDFYHYDKDMKSLSAKRNIAISECKTKYIMFTDDDCIPDPEWVTNTLKCFLINSDIKCVTGSVKRLINYGVKSDRLDYDKMGSTPRLIKFKIFNFVNIMKLGTGGNMSFDSKIFEEIGKFDELLGTGTLAYAGEDRDILYRVLKSGYSIYYEPNAIVYHNDTTKKNAYRVAYRYGYGTQMVLKKHNDLRCHILYVLGLSKYFLNYLLSIFETDRRLIEFNLIKGFLGLKEIIYMDKVNICGAIIDNLSFREAIYSINRFVKNRSNVYVVTPNIDHIVRLRKDIVFKNIYGNAALVLPDGMPVIWAAQFLGAPLKEKVSGADIFPELCSLAARSKYSVFLLGGRKTAVEKTALKLTNKYPDLKIAGTYCPSFGFERDVEETKKIVEIIKSAKPDILFVGVGSPKQEKWIYDHKDEYIVPVSIGVGAAFDFISGIVKRAPVWMQKTGLEWLWRLIMEPKRLWKRYLVDDVQFFALLLKQKFNAK